MPITQAELNKYQAANSPEDDTSISGGAINIAGISDLLPMSVNDAVSVVSNGADVRTVTVTGRDATGAIVSEVLTLNGTTTVVGAQVFERILKTVLSAADGSRTVTVRENIATFGLSTMGPNITSNRRYFYDSTSEASATTRYEKEFWRNENATLTLNNATLNLTSDPSTKIMIGADTAKDSSASVANRKAVPAGVTFVDDNIDSGIPGGNLAAGEAIGIWIRLDLLAGDAALKSSYITTLAGTSV